MEADAYPGKNEIMERVASAGNLIRLPFKGGGPSRNYCVGGAVGDPLTTALFILGTEKGMKIVKGLGYEAIFVDDKGQVTMTPGIKKVEDPQTR